MSGINRTTELIKEFGFSVTFAKLFQTCTRQIPGVQDIAGKIKYAAITKFLYNENKDIIEKYNRESHESTSKIENGTVWVLWWQGIDKAQDIVKICIQSIRKNIGNRNLVILDESNFRDYTNLNPKYENLLNAGAISKTQFSDLLRLNLLYNRGGVWLDSTYLLTGELPSCISDLHFFTIRHGMNREYPMSKGLWTSSALGVAAYADEIKLFIDIYNNYFEKHNVLIDYLLTDYVFAVCCDHCATIRKMFTNVPPNNERVNDLLEVMNKPYSKELVGAVTGKTVMNKCNRRFPFQESVSGTETVYGHFRNMYL